MMKIRDLARARQDFDQRYEIDYRKPSPADEVKSEKNDNRLLKIWGIVAFAGAIISLPHTLRAVTESVTGGENALPLWLSIGYSIAVFIGVELALIASAYTQAVNELKSPHKKRTMTARTILKGIVFRMGFTDTPYLKSELSPKEQPTIGHKKADGGVSVLLIALFVSALIFNQADATQDETLKMWTKYISGALAPALLLLAGHQFAHLLASKQLAGELAKREYDTRVQAWEHERDEAWRAFVATLDTDTAPMKTRKATVKVDEGMSADDDHHHAGMTNGKGNVSDFLAVTMNGFHQNGNGNAPKNDG